MHRVACRIAAYSVSHGWIDDDAFSLCTFAFERRLSLALFLIVQFLVCFPAGKLFEGSIYISVTIAFRRRMGGIHASSAWLCQIVSTVVVFLAVFIIGPFINHLPHSIIYIGDAILILFTYFLKPAYPPQAHFTHCDQCGNVHRKNSMLIALLLLQLLSLLFLDIRFIVYSLTSLLTVVITVIIGKINYSRKDVKINESS